MAFVNVNFRMDEDLKKQMEITCKELGLNMSTAFNIFAKKMTRESRIPFEVSYDPFYSESNIKEALKHEMAFTKDDQQWYEYEQREKAIRDYNAIIEDNKEEGRQEGRQEEKYNNAINCLKLGADIEFTSKVTGLSLEQVQQLQKQIKP